MPEKISTLELKRETLTRPLELKRETLRVLNDDQLGDIHGGTDGGEQHQAHAEHQYDGDPDRPQ